MQRLASQGLLLCAMLAPVLLVAPLAARTPQAEAALARARAGDIDRAVELAETATQAAPRDADAWFVQGQILCSQAQSGSKLKALGRARHCRDAFVQAVALDPLSFDANVGLMQFFLQAPGIAGGDDDKGNAVIAATRVRAPALHAFLEGLKASMAKDLKTTEQQYLRAVQLAPDEARYRSSLVAGYTSQKRYADAFGTVDAGLARKPEDVLLRFQLARTAAISGQRLDESLAHLDALAAQASLPPTVSRAGIAFRRGMILAKLGRTSEARVAYAAARRFDARLAGEIDPELAKL
ncbi:MAG: hypothetical protein ABIP49_03630 [Lysobacterales bacterium]